MAGFKWNTGKLYYSTVELGNQQKVIHTFIPWGSYGALRTEKSNVRRAAALGYAYSVLS